ncbi:Uncharacterised protein [Klebsiella variicola]|nr:Uncharacterised protein [Klebsiella variicola]
MSDKWDDHIIAVAVNNPFQFFPERDCGITVVLFDVCSAGVAFVFAKDFKMTTNTTH